MKISTMYDGYVGRAPAQLQSGRVTGIVTIRKGERRAPPIGMFGDIWASCSSVRRRKFQARFAVR